MKEIGHIIFESVIWLTMVMFAFRGYTELAMVQCTMLPWFTMRHIADEWLDDNDRNSL